ncbi:MAG: nucleotidyltransferase domain-containing protein [Theionarchaea archaeon]|nr:nucleotidyltransferase domain-containing protein [Theionarchaea archaeon]
MVQKNEHVFEKLNLTPLTLDVLLWLARNPGKDFYVREIADSIQGSLGGCHTVLHALHAYGLLTRRISGKNVYYTINEEDPQIHFFKIFMNIHELRGLVLNIQPLCRRIVLFGSCAVGEDTMESDIDLFVITDAVDIIRKKARSYPLSRNVELVAITPRDFLKLKEKDKAFYDQVSQGIVLWRGEQ